MLDNNLKAPPVSGNGDPYTKEEYAKAQLMFAKHSPLALQQHVSIVNYARARAILASAAKQGNGTVNLANLEIDELLNKLAKKYGQDEKTYPLHPRNQPQFASALKLIREDVDAMETEMRKPDDAPDRKVPSTTPLEFCQG